MLLGGKRAAHDCIMHTALINVLTSYHIIASTCVYCNCLNTAQAVWSRFYSTSSVRDKGTLYNLRNLLNRTSVPQNVKKNVNAVEDFLEVLVQGHILAAALKITGLASLEDFDEGVGKNNPIKQTAVLVVQTFIVPYFFGNEDPSSGTSADHVRNYTCDFLAHGLLWYSFRDAIREGDGPAVLQMWRILMVIFR